jgi:predicted DsbA family dithiol-disulfide isomerase
MNKLSVDIWSDVVCPWCYVGKRRFERALELFEHRAEVEVVWHAFELDPRAPRETDRSVSYAERLARKYGSSVEEAESRIARLSEVAQGDGLSFHFDKARPGNTFDAHRVIHLGLEKGQQDTVQERLLRAYMTEGEAIGDRDVLLRLAAEVGFDRAEVLDVLEGDRFANEVRADEQLARELGIQGVPFFVIARRYGVSGAQPAELLLGALDQAWKEMGAGPAAFDEGAACGPEGCD